MSTSIAAVIPTYNRAGCIADAVNSVLGQTRAPDEVIVVDDGSTDNTAEVLAQFGDRIRVIRQANGGVSRARNAGIEAARSEWIAFLDSDDEWLQAHLQLASEHLARTDVVGVFGNALVYRRDGDESPQDFFAHRGGCGALKDLSPARVALDAWIMTPTVIAKREGLLKAEGFDSALSMFEDMDLFARLALLGRWVALAEPQAAVIRRSISGESLSDQSRSKRHHSSRSIIAVYEKLMRIGGWTEGDSAIIRNRLAGRLAELASEYRTDGKLRSAWSTATKAMQIRLAMPVLLRSGVAVLGGEAGLRWIDGMLGRGSGTLR